MTDTSVPDLLLVSVVNATNILTYFIFISRVKWPNSHSKLAIVTIVMAIPAIVIASLNKTTGREWLYWVMPTDRKVQIAMEAVDHRRNWNEQI